MEGYLELQNQMRFYKLLLECQMEGYLESIWSSKTKCSFLKGYRDARWSVTQSVWISKPKSFLSLTVCPLAYLPYAHSNLKLTYLLRAMINDDDAHDAHDNGGGEDVDNDDAKIQEQ